MQGNNLENKVMSEIKSGRVKLRSRYIFLAEKLGIGSALIFSILLAILFCSLGLFYLKSSDNLWYLSFGSRGVLAFLESFPYLLVVTFIILILLAGFILKKSGVMYQKPFGYLALALIGFVIIAGLSLASTRVMEAIERGAFGGRQPGALLHPFLGRIEQERDWGVTGQVTEIGDNYVSIQTPRRVIKIELDKLKIPLTSPVSVGDFVMAVGERKDGRFEPQELRIRNPQDMPMIIRGIHRRLGPSASSTWPENIPKPTF